MPQWQGRPFRRGGRGEIRDLRREMIEQTSAFLTWALSTDADVPRIPTRRMDKGGFTEMLRHRGARAAAERWWTRVLDATLS